MSYTYAFIKRCSSNKITTLNHELIQNRSRSYFTEITVALIFILKTNTTTCNTCKKSYPRYSVDTNIVQIKN